MMKKLYIILILIILLPLGASAQRTYSGSISLRDVQADKQGQTLHLEATLDPADIDMNRQHMLVVTPVLRSLDRTQQITFDPVMIVGTVRHKVNERAELLDGLYLEKRPSQTIIYRPNRDMEPIRMRMNVPYQAWMRQGELVFEEEVTGCRNLELTHNTYRGLSPILPPVYQPTYQISYVIPPTEEVKQRSDTYEARLNFRVNRSDIERDYMNNATVLNEVDQIIREVHNDQNLTVNQFKVTGYASPEGAAAHNLTLSENRAKSFVRYVQGQHSIPQNVVQVDWKGDDWDGLRKVMQESNFAGKQQVLNILDGTTDPQQRKNQLRNMGTAYRTLVDEYYPYLRRNEYTIGYIARPFSVDEAKAVVKTKPQQLSLNEMYLVANTYPKTSSDFKEVFDIAVRLYPNDPYANLNSAALDIENGAYDSALERALKVDMPESWNNVGYIYVKKGDYTRAAEYFKRAADAGLPVARENLNELNRWLEDPE